MRVFLAATAAVLCGSAVQTAASTVPAASFAVDANVSVTLVSALRNGEPAGASFYNTMGGYTRADGSFVGFPSEAEAVYHGDLGSGDIFGWTSAGPMRGSKTNADSRPIYLHGGEILAYQHLYRAECIDFNRSSYPEGPDDCAGDSITVTFDYILDISASAKVPDLMAKHEASARLWATMDIIVGNYLCCDLAPGAPPGDRFQLNETVVAATSGNDTLVRQRTLREGQISVTVFAGQQVTTTSWFDYSGRANLAAPPPPPLVSTPLPAPALLLGGALAGLVGLRRVRRKA